MRKQEGDLLGVVDGKGNTYECSIVSIERRSARCLIRARHHMLNEPPRQIVLAVGILKNSAKFDFLVEKTTELGVNTIVPLQTARTIPRRSKSERWQKIALAAMKQSGRCVLPTVSPLTNFSDFLKGIPKGALTVMPFERSTASWRTAAGLANPEGTVVVCVGPEGGFEDEEVESARREGFHLVSFGDRRLRTETAAIVATAAFLL
jgi:16S rRNA (uracil1498-N3)-methyltransferase